MRLRVLVAVTAVAASCASSSVEHAPWVLTDQPTGSQLQIRAEYGGSSCTSFREWRVDESAEMVEVVALVERSGAEQCTADLVHEDVTIDLDAPIDGRTLHGCRPDRSDADCRRVGDQP